MLKIVEIHPGTSASELNTEWFVLENASEKPFTTRSCTLAVSRKGAKKKKDLGTLDPGFILAPGQRARVITGNPGRKAHGAPPADELPNYHLFLGEPVLRGPGTQLHFSLRSLVLASAAFDPDARSGVGVARDASPAAE